MDDSRLVLLNSYGSRAEAELVKGALEAAGIRAITLADTVGGMREHIAWSGGGFQILVLEEDVAAARLALTQAVEDKSEDSEGDPKQSYRHFT